MKRIITYITILAAAMTAGVSCSQSLILDESQEGGKLTLHFITEQMGTKVTVEDGASVKGVGAENTIDHVDYFFFADNNPDSEAIVSGRLELSDLTKVSDTEYKYDGFDTEEEAYAELKKPSYLYVLVNYPSAVNATKMSQLLALPITTDFTQAQTSFVMDSALLPLTPASKNERRDVEVKLARVAAKLLLNINVKNSYEDAAGNVWTPVTDQMWVNFLYGRKAATVAAEPVAFDEKANYFNTAQETPTSTTAVDTDHTSWKASPVYTYPQSYKTSDVTAPYFKIFCPWICEKKGMNNFYYKIILPEIGSFQRNKIYTLTVDLSVIGGTEDDWALTTNNIYVADWWAPSAIESSFEGAMYLDVPVKEYEIYGVDDVYIPVRSSNDIQITNIRGTKTNLYNGNTVNVTGSTSDVTKDGFKFVHSLNDDITSTNFDCTPITFTMTVQHTSGGLSKTVNVKVTQYPSIYAEADRSNGYAYVNSYANNSVSGGRHSSSTAYNSRNDNSGDNIGSMNYLGGSGSLNNNANQYVIHVSILPTGYKVQGMADDAVIGDPRGGQLAYNYLGYYGYGSTGTVTRDVKSKYNAVSSTTQNVIAPAIRIASSWGAQGTMQNYDRAEERCASYQENGYPAGRWRVPTIAEVDFLIRLSTYNHIPELFTCRDRGTYYEGYWANGPSAYAGKPYTDDGYSRPYESGDITNTNNNRVRINGRTFDLVVRCVYDEWYWGSNKYNSQGNEITGTGSAATQWIGYKF